MNEFCPETTILCPKSTTNFYLTLRPHTLLACSTTEGPSENSLHSTMPLATVLPMVTTVTTYLRACRYVNYLTSMSCKFDTEISCSHILSAIFPNIYILSCEIFAILQPWDQHWRIYQRQNPSELWKAVIRVYNESVVSLKSLTRN